MVAWREAARTVAFEGLRLLISFKGDSLAKGSSCKQSSLETSACLGALEECLDIRWKLVGQLEGLEYLNSSLSGCRTKLAEAPVVGHCNLIGVVVTSVVLGVCLGLAIGKVFTFFPAKKVRAKKCKKPIRGTPLHLKFVDSVLALQELEKDGKSSSGSTSSSVARARARARALQG